MYVSLIYNFVRIYTADILFLSVWLFTSLFWTRSDFYISAVRSCGDFVCEKKTIFKNLVLPVFANAESFR